jgi:hypothetical protein
MENDKLKSFIDQHRPDFDTEKAPDIIWTKLSDNLSKAGSNRRLIKKPIWYFISGVAATLLLLVVALVGYQIGISNLRGFGDNQAIQEYAAKEKVYLQEISDKMQFLQSNQLDNSIQNDLIELDAVYQELKAELLENKHGNSGLILDALIKNYQTKIDILQMILEKQVEGKKEEDNEGFKI